MEVTSVVFRISGNLGLSDNSTRTFLGQLEQDGPSKRDILNISFDANEAFRANFPTKKEEIEALSPYSATIFPAGQIVPSGDPVDAGLVVNSLSMVMTGRVTYSNNTQKDFSYEVRDDGSVYAHEAEEGDVAWADAFGPLGGPKIVAEIILTTLYSAMDDSITVTLS